MPANAYFIALHSEPARRVYARKGREQSGIPLTLGCALMRATNASMLSLQEALELQAPSSGKPPEQQGRSAQQRAGR
jgi:hypothetical protein